MLLLKTSSKNTINIPYDILANSFNLDKHFLLQGIKNHTFLYAKIKENESNRILVNERKGMWFSYTKTNDNKTAVECYFPYGLLSIIVWVILLSLIIGFILLPVILLMRFLIVKQNIKKIEKNYLLVFEKELQNNQTSTSKSKNEHSLPPNYSQINSLISVEETKKTPPPFKTNTRSDNENILSGPPPLPQKLENSDKTLPPPLPKTIEYYIEFQGNQKGPISIYTLKEMTKQHLIEKDTLIWREGMTEWKKISEIEL